jgi:hypothetical protein
VGGPERVERRLACSKEDAEQCDALLSLVGDAVLLPPERRTKTERESNRHFVNMPGHEASAHGWAEVIARTDGYVTVAKIGRRRETLPA